MRHARCPAFLAGCALLCRCARLGHLLFGLVVFVRPLEGPPERGDPVAPVSRAWLSPVCQDDAKATIGQLTMMPLAANVVPCAVPLNPTTVP